MNPRLKMYAPFLVVALVQALFVGLYPSTGEDRSAVATGFDTDFGTGDFGSPGTTPDGSVAPGSGATRPGGNGATTVPGQAGPGGTTGGDIAAPATSSGGGTAPAGSTPAGDGTAQPTQQPTPAAQAGGDTSHCVGELQFDIFVVPRENPRCIPKFPDGADNGGATWTGVTADSIKVVVMEESSSEAVNAVLRSQGLAASDEDRQRINDAATSFINTNYETYGRTIEFIRYPSNCPQSPADVPACIADVRKVIEMQPFAVFFNQPSYPELFEELTRAGIISIGGWHFSKELFAERRPFRWDVFIDGTDSARFDAEYYCKKLATGTATHSGAVIHPQIGTRGDVARKLGIVVADNQAFLPDAELIRNEVNGCGGTAEVFTYTRDINQASSEANNLTAQLVSAGVTTVLCICDPIFPTFLTSSHTAASYFPEHMLAGSNLLDADTVGRLYDQQQWIHAFGPSHLADTRPFEDEQVSRVFAAEGVSPPPCQSCNLYWVYYSLFAQMVHNAGPNLNPGTVEQGLFSLGGFRGDGQVIGLGYGPGDYSAIDDVREAYWVPNAISQVDGKRGSYRSTNDGKRYGLGEFPTSFDVPVEPQS